MLWLGNKFEHRKYFNLLVVIGMYDMISSLQSSVTDGSAKLLFDCCRTGQTLYKIWKGQI